jgi:tripartite-type tricarboxylate transporter receptor subunit TctC
VPALIGGQVDVAFSALPSVSGFVKANQIKLLATNAGKRSPNEPNVPAIAEIVPSFDFAVIVGVLASTGTPLAVIERISAEIDKVAKAPETIQILANAGIEAVGGKPGDYAKAITDENDRLGKVLKTVSIKQE